MVSKYKLRSKIIEKNTTADEVAKKIGMSPSTFYRKIKNNAFNIKEVSAIADALSLTKDEALAIFFAK